MPWQENDHPSIMERKAAMLLDQGDILYVTEFSFPDLKSDRGIPLRFDFAIFESPEDMEKERPKFLLEMQGEQHYKQKFQTKEGFEDSRLTIRESVPTVRLKDILQSQFRTLNTIQ